MHCYSNIHCGYEVQLSCFSEIKTGFICLQCYDLNCTNHMSSITQYEGIRQYGVGESSIEAGCMSITI